MKSYLPYTLVCTCSLLAVCYLYNIYARLHFCCSSIFSGYQVIKNHTYICSITHLVRVNLLQVTISSCFINSVSYPYKYISRTGYRYLSSLFILSAAWSFIFCPRAIFSWQLWHKTTNIAANIHTASFIRDTFLKYGYSFELYAWNGDLIELISVPGFPFIKHHFEKNSEQIEKSNPKMLLQTMFIPRDDLFYFNLSIQS